MGAAVVAMAAAVVAMAAAVEATAAVEAAVDAATAAAANGAVDKPAHLRGKRFCRPGPLSGP
jgi:replication-associated recombination protein RarA